MNPHLSPFPHHFYSPPFFPININPYYSNPINCTSCTLAPSLFVYHDHDTDYHHHWYDVMYPLSVTIDLVPIRCNLVIQHEQLPFKWSQFPHSRSIWVDNPYVKPTKYFGSKPCAHPSWHWHRISILKICIGSIYPSFCFFVSDSQWLGLLLLTFTQFTFLYPVPCTIILASLSGMALFELLFVSESFPCITIYGQHIPRIYTTKKRKKEWIEWMAVNGFWFIALIRYMMWRHVQCSKWFGVSLSGSGSGIATKSKTLLIGIIDQTSSRGNHHHHTPPDIPSHHNETALPRTMFSPTH